jgi:DNA topoisomerase-2
VSEHSAYHHGEASLASTIVGLAQDFVGSNNINLLVPSGQFGTRALGDLIFTFPLFDSRARCT